jgi:hypothetical protein
MRGRRRCALFLLSLVPVLALCAWLTRNTWQPASRAAEIRESSEVRVANVEQTVRALRREAAAHVPVTNVNAILVRAVPLPEPPPEPEPEPAPEPEPVATEPEAPAVPEFVLKGIIRRGADLLAIINGELVSPGDTIEGFQVRYIRANRVKLEDADGREILLNVFEEP